VAELEEQRRKNEEAHANEIEKLEARIQQATNKRNEDLENARVIQLRIDALEQTRKVTEALDGDMKILNQLAQDIERKLHDAKTREADYTARISALESEKENLEKTIDQQGLDAKHKSEHNARVMKLRLDQLIEKKTSLDRKLGSLRTELRESERDRATAEKKLQTERARHVRMMERRIQEAESRRKEHEATLMGRIKRKQRELNRAHASEKASLTRDLENMKEQLALLEKEREEHAHALASLKTKIRESESLTVDLNTRNQDLLNTIQGLNSRNAEIQHQKDASDNSIADLQAMLDALRSKNEKQEKAQSKESEDLKEQALQLQHELEGKKTENASLVAKIDENNAEISKLKTQLTEEESPRTTATSEAQREKIDKDKIIATHKMQISAYAREKEESDTRVRELTKELEKNKKAKGHLVDNITANKSKYKRGKDDLELRIRQLEEKRNEELETNRRLRNAISSKEETTEMLIADVRKLSEENSNLSNKLNDYNISDVKVKEEIKELSTKRDLLLARVRDQFAEIQLLRKNLNEESSQIAVLRAHISSLVDEVNQALEQKQSAEAELQKATISLQSSRDESEAHQKSVNKIQADLSALSLKSAQSDSRVMEMEAEKKRTDALVIDLENEISELRSLKTEAKKLKEELTEKEGEIKTLNRQIEETKGKLSALETTIKSLESNNSSHEGALKLAQEELASTRGKLRLLESDISRMVGDAAIAQKQLSKRNEDIATMQLAVQEKTSEIERMRIEHERDISQLDIKVQQCMQLQNSSDLQIRDLIQQITNHHNLQAASKANIQLLEQQIREYKKNVASLTSDAQTKIQELASATAREDRLNVTIDQLKEEQDKLKSTIATLKATHTEAEISKNRELLELQVRNKNILDTEMTLRQQLAEKLENTNKLSTLVSSISSVLVCSEDDITECVSNQKRALEAKKREVDSLSLKLSEQATLNDQSIADLGRRIAEQAEIIPNVRNAAECGPQTGADGTDNTAECVQGVMQRLRTSEASNMHHIGTLEKLADAAGCSTSNDKMPCIAAALSLGKKARAAAKDGGWYTDSDDTERIDEATLRSIGSLRDIEDTKKRLEQLSLKNEELAGMVRSMQAVIQDLELSKENAATELTAHRDSTAAMVSRQETAISNLSTMLKGARDDIDTKSNKIIELQNQIAFLVDEKSKANKLTEKHESEIYGLRVELATAQSAFQQNKQENRSLKNRVDLLQAQNDDITKENEFLRSENIELVHNNEVSSAIQADLSQQVSELESSLDASRLALRTCAHTALTALINMLADSIQGPIWEAVSRHIKSLVELYQNDKSLEAAAFRVHLKTKLQRYAQSRGAPPQITGKQVEPTKQDEDYLRIITGKLTKATTAATIFKGIHEIHELKRGITQILGTLEQHISGMVSLEDAENRLGSMDHSCIHYIRAIFVQATNTDPKPLTVLKLDTEPLQRIVDRLIPTRSVHTLQEVIDTLVTKARVEQNIPGDVYLLRAMLVTVCIIEARDKTSAKPDDTQEELNLALLVGLIEKRSSLERSSDAHTEPEVDTEPVIDESTTESLYSNDLEEKYLEVERGVRASLIRGNQSHPESIAPIRLDIRVADKLRSISDINIDRSSDTLKSKSDSNIGHSPEIHVTENMSPIQKLKQNIIAALDLHEQQNRIPALDQPESQKHSADKLGKSGMIHLSPIVEELIHSVEQGGGSSEWLQGIGTSQLAHRGLPTRKAVTGRPLTPAPASKPMLRSSKKRPRFGNFVYFV
jgi:chromosome segregation ATPase